MVQIDSHKAELDAHLADTTAAHAATAISFSPTGTIASSTVQAAIAEVASEASGGVQGVINVKTDYGAVGNNVADDTAAIQAAIDDAETMINGTYFYGAPTIYFPPGRYSVTDTIVWKSARLQGSFVHTGTQLAWNGSAGGTVIEREATNVVGSMSFNKISDMSLVTGSAIPATFIDLTTGFNVGAVDKFGQMENVYFQGCSGDAIKVAFWWNCHWYGLRFDDVGGFPILLTTSDSALNYCSFLLTRFTYATSVGGGTLGKGLLKIDNTAGATDIGIVKIENARIEMGRPWTGNKGLIEIEGAISPGGVHLADIAIAGNGSGNSILYSNSATANIYHRLQMTNVQCTNIANVCGGTWWSSLTLPSMVGHWGYLDFPSAGSPSFNAGVAGWYQFEGSPEGVVPAPPSSLYSDTLNGELYIKKTGSGDTGWKLVTHAA